VAKGFYTDKDGKVRPINGSSSGGAKKLVVAAGLVTVVGTSGAMSLGGGGAAFEGADAAADALTGNTAGDVVDSLPGRNPATRKAEARTSAERGKSNEAWSRMRLKQLKRKAEKDLRCLINSTGQIREFFLRTPCTSLDRLLLAVGDGQGNAAVISVAWVGFRTKRDVESFKRLEDVHGNGDITPEGAGLLGLAGIHFTAHHYHCRPNGKTAIVAEAETATGHFADTTLDAIAEIATYLPQP
jgi:hypothetical protein